DDVRTNRRKERPQHLAEELAERSADRHRAEYRRLGNGDVQKRRQDTPYEHIAGEPGDVRNRSPATQKGRRKKSKLDRNAPRNQAEKPNSPVREVGPDRPDPIASFYVRLDRIGSKARERQRRVHCGGEKRECSCLSTTIERRLCLLRRRRDETRDGTARREN